MHITDRFWLNAAMVLLFSYGCGSGHGDPSGLPRGWDILERDANDSLQVSRKVMLVADNQIHYLYGDPFLHRNVFADKYFSSVTIRSPQLDLFGQDLFEWAISSSQRIPIIHLGDALDLACGAEFTRFVELMRESGRPWIMTPGNHDSYFYGNFDSGDYSWNKACQGGGGPMHKTLLLERYLGELGRTRPSLLAQFRTHPDRGEWTCDRRVETDCFLRAVSWNIERQSRWRSYLVQEVDLRRNESAEGFRAILFDSTQHSSTPRELLLHAGAEGNVLEDQAAVIRAWLDRAEQDGARVVLATHHPFDTLSRDARDRVASFMTRMPAILLVTAHTHAGRYYTHGKGEDTWLELNVGSILDWPAEYRTLAFRRRLVGQSVDTRSLIVESELVRIAQQWKQDMESDTPQCDEPSWEARPGDPDYYLDYRSLALLDVEATQRRIYDNLLAAYSRMFRCLPRRDGDEPGGDSPTMQPSTGCRVDSEVETQIQQAMTSDSLATKRSQLLRLREHEQSRSYADDRAHREYRLCQASWASRYEDRRARVPSVEDEFIVIQGSGDTGRLP